jgi:hypothetical protein
MDGQFFPDRVKERKRLVEDAVGTPEQRCHLGNAGNVGDVVHSWLDTISTVYTCAGGSDVTVFLITKFSVIIKANVVLSFVTFAP